MNDSSSANLRRRWYRLGAWVYIDLRRQVGSRVYQNDGATDHVRHSRQIKIVRSAGVRQRLALGHLQDFLSKRQKAVLGYRTPTKTHHFRLRARAKRRFRAFRSHLVSGRPELWCASSLDECR
jgi:hypothetical protein